ncbi:MAG: isoleucine--tRNA ligase [Candidatus Moraniibacteriota bacterium]
MQFKKVDSRKKYSEMEKEIIQFWRENKTFEKSISNRPADKLYSFYDGPPFATGTPHYGHIVASAIKDVVPRFWTMKGYRVPRKWGWDCHGLPIENIAEKELGIKQKNQIEELGVEKFNEVCRSKVLTYVDQWKVVIERMGRWADMENSYRTMDKDFMESIWWVFKELWDKGLIYEDYRSMHICPRCETTLSQSEVAEGYKIVKDLSATAKFELVDEPGTFVLAWTTTPWTLIGNVALAVGEDIDYIMAKLNVGQGMKKLSASEVPPVIDEKFEYYVVAEELYELIFGEFGGRVEVIKKMKGSELVGKKYKPLFDYYAKDEKLENRENGWQIYAGDFVTTEDGTGVVHIASAFGSDDMALGKLHKLPFVQHVRMDGSIKEEAIDFAGMNVKPIDDHQKTDIEIIKFLAHSGTLFSKEKYEHSYPHCWRCETPLLNYATSSWFVSVLKIKERMLEIAKEINWSPEHIKNGRWGKWLEGARDWSISRQRYWASVIPIWKCDCGEMKVIGSIAELEKLSGKVVTDLHKHSVDGVTFSCEKCNGTMKRIPDVLDCWFESGSMPYAQLHYPFENKEQFEKSFPANFIAEGVDQTRAWFYYLHVIASGIKDKQAFQNVVVNGIVLAEDGKKMSKRLQNYPDPMDVLEKYGADVLRFYFMSSPVVSAQNLNFSEKELAELSRGMFRMLWNTYSFFVLYAEVDGWQPNQVGVGELKNKLDQWIISELNSLIKNFNSEMEAYQLNRAARLFPEFIDNLSNWYVRRSRRRFWKSESDEDKNAAYQTLWTVLTELSKVLAPFCPFVAEEIYKNLTGEESVHLVDFPVADEEKINEKLNFQMNLLRRVVNVGLSLRAESKKKVRQPLETLYVAGKYEKEVNEMTDNLRMLWIMLEEELNVKGLIVSKDKVERDGIIWKEDGDLLVGLNIIITPELKLEGTARELVRAIQEMRKEAGYEVDNHIKIGHVGAEEVFAKFGELIAKETLANDISAGELAEADLQKDVLIDEVKCGIFIKKD